MEVSNLELEPEHELLGSVAGDGILEFCVGVVGKRGGKVPLLCFCFCAHSSKEEKKKKEEA